MKKLFFFRNTASNSGNDTVSSQPIDKKVYCESSLENGRNSPRGSKGSSSKSPKKISENQSSDANSGLRKSRSYTPAAFYSEVLGQRSSSCLTDHSRSPSISNSSLQLQHSDNSCGHSNTPDKKPKKKLFQVEAVPNAYMVEKSCSASSSRALHDSPCISSFCSTNGSNTILDHYIDGEQQPEMIKPANTSSQRYQSGYEHNGGKRPPQVQNAAPASPTSSIKEKPRAHLFRENGGTSFYFSTGDRREKGFAHESPRQIAKHMVERLSQSHVLPKTVPKDSDADIPITLEDIYGGALNRLSSQNLDCIDRNRCSFDGPPEMVNEYREEEVSSFDKQTNFFGNNSRVMNKVRSDEDLTAELDKKSKKAEARILSMSEELEQDSFLGDGGFSMQALMQTLRNLMEDKMNLALEVSATLQGHMADRACTKEELNRIKAEFDSRIHRLEREKIELQSGLEKELDRRSSDWSFKLEKYQAEEKRLRDRVRELAEQNVSLQREVSSFNEREMENKSMISYSEIQMKGLSSIVEKARLENDDLQVSFSELQEKYRAEEEDRQCFQRNYEEKDKECKELQKSVSRLLRTCSEQEKTISGLQHGLNEEIGKMKYLENFDKEMGKMQMEQLRLTGVEHTLRKKVESCRLELDSLRHENVNLLTRLNGNGKDCGFSALKLDQELWSRVSYLQDQGLSLLNESTWLCSKLLEFIKVGRTPENKHEFEAIKHGLDGQFVVESEMKVQGFKQGTESLKKSLQVLSTVLHEKPSAAASESLSQCTEDVTSGQPTGQAFEDQVRTELKAETLITTILREKLYMKELEVEQLQAEVATAVRGNDILQHEVQNSLDTLCCMSHKMKDLELQAIMKDEKSNQLGREIEECKNELSITRGVLTKISEERDIMWEEVKQYSEKNMLLNSEVVSLKKKMEALDEDILLKEGQITILKDSLGKPRPTWKSGSYT
ncbi:hypothetical protein RJ641_036199 [Dillenia turbinata]|uniref:DUF7653 domain-containing protein n=1 Tax=Dillenia turbinata TaxID=194707 RepID=A0AAN8VFU9_9MAGN